MSNLRDRGSSQWWVLPRRFQSWIMNAKSTLFLDDVNGCAAAVGRFAKMARVFCSYDRKVTHKHNQPTKTIRYSGGGHLVPPRYQQLFATELFVVAVNDSSTLRNLLGLDGSSCLVEAFVNLNLNFNLILKVNDKGSMYNHLQHFGGGGESYYSLACASL